MTTGSEIDERQYVIRFDPVDGILHMRLEGFWTLVTLATYTARLVAETSKLRLRGRSFDILSDARGFAVQSAAVTAGFDALSRKGAASHRGRTAIVVASTLNKIQAERSLVLDKVRVFLDMQEARQWLIDGRGPGGS